MSIFIILHNLDICKLIVMIVEIPFVLHVVNGIQVYLHEYIYIK